MKKLILPLLGLVPVFCSGQYLVKNEGAMIKVQAGATLFVEGGIHNTSAGTIDNDGTIDVQGHFLNEGTWNAADPNILKFSGTADADLTPGSAIFQTVQMAKTAGGDVNLLGHTTIQTLLDFNGADTRIRMGAHDLKLQAGAMVAGYGATEYVASTGAGMMEKAVTADGTFEFPIGDASNYSPLECDYTGSSYTAATLRANVVDDVHPNKPSDATEFITRYWNINSSGIADYDNLLTGTYIPADLTLGSGGTASQVKGSIYDGAEWYYLDAASGSNIVMGSTDETNADFTGTNFFGKVLMTTLLQGPFNGTLMTTTLTANPTIEALMLNSPYADAPASVADIPAGVTDWIKIELRDPGNPATVLGRKSAFIKNDGTIVDLDGVSTPKIKNGLPVSIVGLVHRTHLSIRTPNAGIDVVNPTPYNFSTNLANAYDNPAVTTNDALFLHAGSGKYLMFASNGNSNANVRFSGPANDRDYLLNTILGGNPTTILSNVYSTGDFNMNGIVRFSGPANDRDFLLNTTLAGNPTNIRNQHY